MVRYNLDFVNKNCKNEVAYYTSKSYYKKEKLDRLLLNDGIIMPSQKDVDGLREGGIYTSDGIYILSATLNGIEPLSKVEFKTENIKKSPETIIFIGEFYSLWGHAITDSLKKIWFLFTGEGKRLLENGAKIGYIFHDKEDSYTLKVLEKAGVNPKVLVEVKEPTQFNHIYIPDSSIIYNPKDESRYYTYEYKEAINRILECFVNTYNSSSFTTAGYDKVYFSRRKFFQNGRDWGECDIEKIFRNLGYKIIYPEQLSFFDQIQILRTCSNFATTEGSISHTAVFCRPGTKVEFVRKCNRLNFHQLMINDAAQLDVTYIDANKSIIIDEQMPLNGPFYMCITEELKRFYNRPIVYLPYWLCFSYWWHLMNKSKFMRKNIKNRNALRRIEFFFGK